MFHNSFKNLVLKIRDEVLIVGRKKKERNAALDQKLTLQYTATPVYEGVEPLSIVKLPCSYCRSGKTFTETDIALHVNTKHPGEVSAVMTRDSRAPMSNKPYNSEEAKRIHAIYIKHRASQNTGIYYDYEQQVFKDRSDLNNGDGETPLQCHTRSLNAVSYHKKIQRSQSSVREMINGSGRIKEAVPLALIQKGSHVLTDYGQYLLDTYQADGLKALHAKVNNWENYNSQMTLATPATLGVVEADVAIDSFGVPIEKWVEPEETMTTDNVSDQQKVMNRQAENIEVAENSYYGTDILPVALRKFADVVEQQLYYSEGLEEVNRLEKAKASRYYNEKEDLQTTITDLRNELATSQETISDDSEFLTEQDGLRAEIVALKIDITARDGTIADHRKTIESHEIDIQDLTASKDSLKRQNQALRDQQQDKALRTTQLKALEREAEEDRKRAEERDKKIRDLLDKDKS